MTETPNFKQIFDEISQSDDHITGKINYYNLTSILEDLYVENAELKERIEKLEKWQDRAQSSSKSVREHIDFEGCYD